MSWQLWFQGWPVFVERIGTASSGWYGPPKGTHGPGSQGAEGGLRDQKLTPGSSAGEKGNDAVSEWLDESSDQTRYGPMGWANSTEVQRESVKVEVARKLSEATGVSEEECAMFVSQWADTTADADMRGLAIQVDAAKEFGVGLSDFTKSRMAEAKRAGGSESEPLLESGKQRALLRAMYDETQAELKARGIKEVTLNRGVGMSKEVGNSLSAGQSIEPMTNSLESWSVDSEVASMFGVSENYGDTVGVLLEATVPAERILSIPSTGFGCLVEGEVVVLGGVAGDVVQVMGVGEELEGELY